MEKLNVAVADDNEKMVEVLGRMIEEDHDLKLVGKAHNGEEICNIIREKEPEVNKTVLKQILKQGAVIPGATLTVKNNIQIK